jgi:hypothetical protein
MYSFRINTEAGRVENDIYRLKDESLIDKFEQDPSVVADLDPSTDAEQIEGCAVLWEYIPTGQKLFPRNDCRGNMSV